MSERPKNGVDPDATVMLSRDDAPAPDPDATVMVPAHRQDDDATVFMPSQSADDDATVMMPARQVDDDATVMIPTGALAGLIGWVLPLAADHVRYGIGPAAASLAAIMGFSGKAFVPLILTCLVGLLLGLTGAWLASAARLLLVPATR